MIRAIRVSRVLAAIALLGAAAPAQVQIQKLEASDDAQGDMLGNALAVSGEWMVVGAEFDGDLGPGTGAAYVYQRQGSSWVEIQKLHAGDGASGSGFGTAVAIDGDRLVVGAHGAVPGIQGGAYVFERTGGTWTQVVKLLGNDSVPGDSFGRSVAIRAASLLVGAPSASAPWLGTGAAYRFENVGGNWTQLQKIVPPGVASGDGFGGAVSLSDNVAAIWASGHDGPGGEFNTGTVYLYQDFNGTWLPVQMLFPSTPQNFQYFGTSISISGPTILVGAMTDDAGAPDSGAAYVFEDHGGFWDETQKLVASDGRIGDNFGFSVAVAGDLALCGTLGDDDSGTQSGSAYVFQKLGSTWIQTGKMLAADGVAGDLVGVAVGIAGTTAVVSATRTDGACPTNPDCDSGSVYVFQLAPTARQYGSCATGSPCTNPDDHGGCRNSTGQGAVLAAAGSGSVSNDDLFFEVTRVPPNKLTLFFMGPAQTSAQYGDGIRFASPQPPVGIYRYGGAAADAQGRGVRGPGLVAQGQGFPAAGRIQAGQTWNFQMWYRDIQGPCHGLTNFSNAVEVGFGP